MVYNLEIIQKLYKLLPVGATNYLIRCYTLPSGTALASWWCREQRVDSLGVGRFKPLCKRMEDVVTKKGRNVRAKRSVSN